jgi:hypothetical protein
MARSEWPDARAVAEVIVVAEEGVDLHVDVLQISADQWALHGRLAYEGDVIAATFPSRDAAWTALTGAVPGRVDLVGHAHPRPR